MTRQSIVLAKRRMVIRERTKLELKSLNMIFILNNVYVNLMSKYLIYFQVASPSKSVKQFIFNKVRISISILSILIDRL
jgi:hypothetical protein